MIRRMRRFCGRMEDRGTERSVPERMRRVGLRRTEGRRSDESRPDVSELRSSEPVGRGRAALKRAEFDALKRAEFDIAPFAGARVLLQGDLSFCDLRKVGEHLVAKFAVSDPLVPIVAADLAFECLDPVKI